MSKLAFALCSAILWFFVSTQAQGSQTGCSPENSTTYCEQATLLMVMQWASATLQNRGFTINVSSRPNFRNPTATDGCGLFRAPRWAISALFRPKSRTSTTFSSRKKKRRKSIVVEWYGYRYTFRD